MKRFDVRLLPIVVVVFLGFLGFSLPFPLFSPMILGENMGFLPESFPYHMRAVLLGVLLAVYPLGQMFGCPFFGQLSDHYGRRKILLISLVFTFISYLASALAVTYSHFILLALSRFFCGVFEGNVVIANSAVADISDEKTKGRNFGFLAAATSLGFVLGPLGGKLADDSILPWFNLALPFWVVCFFVIFTFFMVYFFFKETLLQKKEEKLNLTQGFLSTYRGLFMPKLRVVFLLNFLIYFGMFSYFNYFSVFLFDVYHFGHKQLPEIIAFVSIPIGISALLFVGPLSRRVSARLATAIGGFCFSFVLLLFPFIINTTFLYVGILIVGVFLGICLTNMVVLVSNRVDVTSQGMALGINQSVQVLAEGITALTGGFLAGFFSSLPLLVGGGISFLGAMILVSPLLKRKLLEIK